MECRAPVAAVACSEAVIEDAPGLEAGGEAVQAGAGREMQLAGVATAAHDGRGGAIGAGTTSNQRIVVCKHPAGRSGMRAALQAALRRRLASAEALGRQLQQLRGLSTR